MEPFIQKPYGEDFSNRSVSNMMSGVMNLPERLAVRIRVFEAHFLQFAASVEFIVTAVCLFPQILHIHTNQHLPQLHKVTVTLILHYTHTQTKIRTKSIQFMTHNI